MASNGTTSDPCGITGNWTNELGSSVMFACNNGHLSGLYNSAVGEAANYYNLSGTYTMAGPTRRDTILGFSVAWNNEAHGNSNSTTSWTGIHYESQNKIFTTWILTRFTSVADKWSNSYVDQNVFERCTTC